jgi:hypothetical protein
MSPALTGPPSLTPQDKAKFARLFAGCGPSNGLVSGKKAISHSRYMLILPYRDRRQGEGRFHEVQAVG